MHLMLFCPLDDSCSLQWPLSAHPERNIHLVVFEQGNSCSTTPSQALPVNELVFSKIAVFHRCGLIFEEHLFYCLGKGRGLLFNGANSSINYGALPAIFYLQLQIAHTTFSTKFKLLIFLLSHTVISIHKQ